MIPIEQWCSGPKVRPYHCLNRLNDWVPMGTFVLSRQPRKMGLVQENLQETWVSLTIQQWYFLQILVQTFRKRRQWTPASKADRVISLACQLISSFVVEDFLWSTGFFSGVPTAKLELSPARCRGKSWLASPEQQIRNRIVVMSWPVPKQPMGIFIKLISKLISKLSN